MSDSTPKPGNDEENPSAGGSAAFLRRVEPALPERIGPYRILRKLGAGGMGAVFEGVHEAIERRVAVKVLHARYSHDPDTVKRFINEARAVNRIDHPGVVLVSDTGQLPDGGAYIVMELLQGETLSKRIRRGAPLPGGEVIDLTAQIAAALAAAHERGIVHRDLKPDNIMVVPDRQMPTGERTKILDFGIAKLAREQDHASLRTQTNTMLGTPYYMSPEQAQGSGKVDAKTDVYAVGVIVYEMLTGKPPFTGDGLGELIVKHMSEPPPLLAEQAPSSPPELQQLVARLLEKDRTKRPTMVEIVEQLEALGEKYPRARTRMSQSLPVVASPNLHEEPHRTSTLSRAARQRPFHTRSGFRVAALGMMASFALAIGLSLSYVRLDSAKMAPPAGSASPITVMTKEPIAATPSMPAPAITTPEKAAGNPVTDSLSAKTEPALVSRTANKPSSSVSASRSRAKKPSSVVVKAPRSTKRQDVRSAIED